MNALVTANILEGHRGTIEATNIDEVRSIIGSYRYDDKKNESDDWFASIASRTMFVTLARIQQSR